MLTVDDLAWFWEQYVDDAARRDHPDASPLNATDLHLLPPTLILLAGKDPLLDEGNAYAAALAKAGVAVLTHVYDGEEHGFLTRPGLVTGAAEAVADAASWIRTLRPDRPTLPPEMVRKLFPPIREGRAS